MDNFNRNMDIFRYKRVIYVRTPVSDEPTEVYDWGSYYENGTHEYYKLFKTSAKINTFKSLKWHLGVIWYLNPQLTPDDFQLLAERLTYPKNGFVTFNIKEQVLDSMIADIYLTDLEIPPRNTARKIIFNWDCNLSVKQKMSISGQIIGRSKKITSDDIYDMMIQLHDNGIKITAAKIADLLKCARKTVNRNMPEELKREKSMLNQQLKLNKLK